MGQKTTELEEQVRELKDKAVAELSDTATEEEVQQVKARYLGRKGSIVALFSQLGSFSSEDKPAAGKLINEAKQAVQTEVERQLERLAQEKKAADRLDVTLPGRRRRLGHKHPLSRVMDDAVAIFRRMGFITADGPDLETEYHNFDALNTPPDHPSRDLEDTFYLPDGRLLRTQTSPVQIRVMENQPPPVRTICPGRCFRRDTPDMTHSMNFHQIEGLYVDRHVTLSELKGTLSRFARELLGPEVNVRFRPHYFPFTEPSIEYDFSCIMCEGKGCSVCKYSGWLEISGAGMVDPAVFEAVGYDPEEWTGYAFGMGVERIAMMRYAINDIRLFYDNNVRFLEQF